MNSKDFFSFQNLKYVDRWVGTPMMNRSNVLEHTARVVYLTSILSECVSVVTREESLELAIFHDMEEVITGDIPYLAKVRYPEIKKVLKKCFPDKSPTVASQIVKMADILDVLYEAAIEVQSGSRISDFIDAPDLVIDMVKHWEEKWSEVTNATTLHNEKRWVSEAAIEVLKEWSGQFILLSGSFINSVEKAIL